MKRSWSFLVAAAVVAAAATPSMTMPAGVASAQMAAAAGRARAFTHAVILDGRGGPPVESGTVVVRGDRIEAAGPSGAVVIPAGADVLDLRGRTLMPGLADMHVHLLGGWDGESVEMLGYRRYLNALLYAGVTTVLDTGNVTPFVVQMRDEIAAGRLTGPRIYCAGPLVDGPDPLWPPISYSVASVDQVPRVIRQLKASRVDIVKAYAGLSVPVVWALAAEARKASLRVLVDQSWRNGSLELAAGGIAAFAHAPDFLFGGDEGLAMLKQRGVMFISTLSVVESKSRRRLQDLAFLAEPLIRDTTPPDFLSSLRADKPSANWERGAMQENEKRFRQQSANLKRVFDAGIAIAAGTDAPYPGVFQGEGIHHELELLVEAGLTPLQAITAATANAAKLVGAGDEWGTIEPGRLANLVVVNGRPDRVVGDSRKIEMVFWQGRQVNRERLKFDAATDPGFRPLTAVSAAR
jgi:imidazolonepropionase-like amidohydrolase